MTVIKSLNRYWIEGGWISESLQAGRERGEASHTCTLLQCRQVCPKRGLANPSFKGRLVVHQQRPAASFPTSASLGIFRSDFREVLLPVMKKVGK